MESNLSSPRTTESSSSSGDTMFGETSGHLRWASPIITCVRNFKGGTLIANSAPFKEALIEAEKIWVEENIDYKTEEDKIADNQQFRNSNRGLPRNDDSSLHVENSRKADFDQISSLEYEVRRLTMENRELKDQQKRLSDSEIKGPEDIAGMLGKIFETDWREAFEYLTVKKRMRDKDAIDDLLRVAESCFIFSQKLSEDHLAGLKEALIVPSIDKHSLRKIQVPDLEDIPASVVEKVHYCRKMISNESFSVVKQLFFLSESLPSKNYAKNEKLTPFIINCLSCAWSASIQDPPMHVVFRLKRGSQFYSDVMAPAQEPGPLVDYLIWPILFLYAKGPLMLKGVVQCMDSKTQNK